MSINSLFVPEREAQIKTAREISVLVFLLLAFSCWTMQTWKYLVFLICFIQQTWSNRSWTVHQFRDLMMTGQALPGRQTCYQAGLYHNLQGTWHGEGMRGKLTQLSSTTSSPTWLKTTATDTKSRGCQILQKQNQLYSFQRAPQAGQNSGLK